LSSSAELYLQENYKFQKQYRNTLFNTSVLKLCDKAHPPPPWSKLLLSLGLMRENSSVFYIIGVYQLQCIFRNHLC
jgi:hypothetical protein